jgi:hypothetical protein
VSLQRRPSRRLIATMPRRYRVVATRAYPGIVRTTVTVLAPAP